MKFADMKIRKELIDSLLKAGFEEAFAIQEHATPVALEGKDVIGKAQSGSGKTIAFLIPMIEKVQRGKGLQALVIAPTRELILQNEEVFKKIAPRLGLRSVSVYGGKSLNIQANALRSGVEVVFATPGRLIDHMKRRNIDLRGIKILVLDEADRMLDMGFINDIDYILRFTPRNRQTLLFSATMPNEIRNIVHRYMNSPVTVELDKETPTVATIEHEAWVALDKDKITCLKYILNREKPSACIIFVRMKHEADRLSRKLSKSYNIAALHGNMSQSQRERVLKDFRNKKVKYLVATDVAARGLDIPKVSHVFNFDLPNDADTFIHRVGRTGRAGASGRAIHIVLPDDANQIAIIEHFAKVKIPKLMYRGSLDKAKAAELERQIMSARAIIPKWTKRTGMPGFGGQQGQRRGRGGSRNGGRSRSRSNDRSRQQRGPKRRGHGGSKKYSRKKRR